MRYLEIDFKNIQNIILKEILLNLDVAMKKFGVEFYLIGARARDFWLSVNDIPPRRFTEDIDFAILMNSMEQFEELRDYLQDTGNFIKSTNIPQRMYTHDREFMIDLLPFGKVENAYYIYFKDKENTRMSTLGLKEVFEKSMPINIGGDVEILTASLPGIVVLKLIAWKDRPEVRSKDLIDISFIIQHYFDLESDLIYEKYNRFFGDELEVYQIAALALGGEIKEILSSSDILNKSILQLLNTQLNLRAKSVMIQIMTQEMNVDADKVIEYIELILKGINE